MSDGLLGAGNHPQDRAAQVVDQNSAPAPNNEVALASALPVAMSWGAPNAGRLLGNAIQLGAPSAVRSLSASSRGASQSARAHASLATMRVASAHERSFGPGTELFVFLEVASRILESPIGQQAMQKLIVSPPPGVNPTDYQDATILVAYLFTIDDLFHNATSDPEKIRVQVEQWLGEPENEKQLASFAQGSLSFPQFFALTSEYELRFWDYLDVLSSVDEVTRLALEWLERNGVRLPNETLLYDQINSEMLDESFTLLQAYLLAQSPDVLTNAAYRRARINAVLEALYSEIGTEFDPDELRTYLEQHLRRLPRIVPGVAGVSRNGERAPTSSTATPAAPRAPSHDGETQEVPKPPLAPMAFYYQALAAQALRKGRVENAINHYLAAGDWLGAARLLNMQNQTVRATSLLVRAYTTSRKPTETLVAATEVARSDAQYLALADAAANTGALRRALRVVLHEAQSKPSETLARLDRFIASRPTKSHSIAELLYHPDHALRVIDRYRSNLVRPAWLILSESLANVGDQAGANRLESQASDYRLRRSVALGERHELTDIASQLHFAMSERSARQIAGTNEDLSPQKYVIFLDPFGHVYIRVSDVDDPESEQYDRLAQRHLLPRNRGEPVVTGDLFQRIQSEGGFVLIGAGMIAKNSEREGILIDGLSAEYPTGHARLEQSSRIMQQVLGVPVIALHRDHGTPIDKEYGLNDIEGHFSTRISNELLEQWQSSGLQAASERDRVQRYVIVQEAGGALHLRINRFDSAGHATVDHRTLAQDAPAEAIVAAGSVALSENGSTLYIDVQTDQYPLGEDALEHAQEIWQEQTGLVVQAIGTLP